MVLACLGDCVAVASIFVSDYEAKYWHFKFGFSGLACVTGCNFILLAIACTVKFNEQISRIEILNKRFGGQCTDEHTRFDFGVDVEAAKTALNDSSKNFTFGYVICGILLMQMFWLSCCAVKYTSVTLGRYSIARG